MAPKSNRVIYLGGSARGGKLKLPQWRRYEGKGGGDDESPVAVVLPPPLLSCMKPMKVFSLHSPFFTTGYPSAGVQIQNSSLILEKFYDMRASPKYHIKWYNKNFAIMRARAYDELPCSCCQGRN